MEAHTWNRNAAANWLLQGGSNQPQPSALRRSTTDRSSNAGSLMGSGGNEMLFTSLKYPPCICLGEHDVRFPVAQEHDSV